MEVKCAEGEEIFTVMNEKMILGVTMRVVTGAEHYTFTVPSLNWNEAKSLN